MRAVPDTRQSTLAWNTLLRAMTVGIRAALLIGLAIWLKPAELGLFGLIAATVTITSYLYGLDFYTFTVRELSESDVQDVRHRVRDQFVVFGAMYLVGGLVLTVLLPWLGLGSGLAVLVALLTISQHATLELYRVLLRLRRTLAASASLFVRDAAWVPACPLAWWLSGDLTIGGVLLFWLLGSIAGNGLAAWLVLRSTPAGRARRVDRVWLTRGIKTGLRMLPGTLALRGLFTVDRMILALIVSPEALGAYVFFASLCTAATGLFETGVMPYFWPRLLEAARSGVRPRRAAAAARALTLACLVGAPALAAVSVGTGLVLAELLPDPTYGAHVEFLLWVSVAYFFTTLSNIPHYKLYAAHRDVAIVGSNAVAFLAFSIVSGVLGIAGAALAVPVGLVVAAILLLVLKSTAARRHGV